MSTSTTDQPEGSGGGSGEGSGVTEQVWQLLPEVDFFDSIHTRFRRDFEYEDDYLSSKYSEYEYKFIDIASLDPDSFVICVGECKDEGFWMLIGKIKHSGMSEVFNHFLCSIC